MLSIAGVIFTSTKSDKYSLAFFVLIRKRYLRLLFIGSVVDLYRPFGRLESVNDELSSPSIFIDALSSALNVSFVQ